MVDLLGLGDLDWGVWIPGLAGVAFFSLGYYLLSRATPGDTVTMALAVASMVVGLVWLAVAYGRLPREEWAAEADDDGFEDPPGVDAGDRE